MIKTNQLLLFFLCTAFWAKSDTLELAAPSYDQIAQFIPEPKKLVTICHTADVVFSLDEFTDLTDLHAGIVLDAAMLDRAIQNLFHKNKPDQILIHKTDHPDGLDLHIVINGCWTFQSIKFTGVWVNRDWYKQYYLMEPGDPFDPQKHEHSMQKINEVCARDGFFNAKTTSEFVYDHKTKSIAITTHLHKADRFAFIDSQLSVQADQGVSQLVIDRVKKVILKKYFRTLRRAKYSKTVLQELARSIKKFLAHEGFLDVSLTLDETLNRKNRTVALHWHIDLHKKRMFIFFGNRFFSNYQLLELMFQFGRSAWLLPASMLADELIRAYQAKGFWDVRIDTREEADRSFFVIKEGTRATIDEITIENVAHTKERRLIKRCFSGLVRRPYFDKEILQQSFDRLMAYYLQEGFLEYRIMGYECVPCKDPGSHRLVVTTQEGERTLIDRVEISEFSHLQNEGPFAVSNKRGQHPCDVVQIQLQKKWLRDYFAKRGYLLASITHEIKKDDEGTICVWHIKQGEQIRFGKTIVQGCTSLPYQYIMRELAYKEGELWDHEKVRRSFLRMKNRQLFDGISFVPLPSDGFGTRPLLLKMHMDDPFEVRIRTGMELQHIRQYQTFGGLAYKVGGTFMVKNPTNHADLFRFDADVASSHREVMVKYLYPWVFNLPVDGLLQGYSIKYEQPGFIGDKKNLYTIFQNGALAGVQYKTMHCDLGANFGFEQARTKITKSDAGTRALAQRLACAMNFDPRLLNKKIPFIFFEPTLMIDYLDSNLDPTRGIFTLLSFKGMFPLNETFSDSYFIKVLVEQSCFVPIGAVVGALRLRVGHIFHRQFCDIIPSERFYLGGAHSIRSYQADHAPPLGCFTDCEGDSHLVPRGGKTMFNFNSELRIPLFDRLRLVLFNDMGILCGDSMADFCANNIVGGTGFGLRFITPIGPLRFDFAVKWKRHFEGERRYNWFLTFGQAF